MSKGIKNSTLTFLTDFKLKHTKASWLSASFLAAAMLFLTSCEDGIDSVGQEVLPGSDQINTFYTDSLEMEFSTKVVDSLSTYAQVRDIFGNYVDPQFGRMTANFYTEFNPSLSTDFIEQAAGDIFFDSVVLRIDVSAAYGRPESPQILQVFELLDTLPTSGASNSQAPPTKGKELSNNYQFTVDGESGEALLSVRLDDELGKKLLFADSASLNNNEAFGQLFPGLAISTKPVDFLSREPGAIYQIFTIGGNTALRLFYKKRDENSQAFFNETASFGINEGTKRFFTYERTETEGTIFEEELSQPDTSSQYEFIQGGSLVQGFVRIPNVQKLGNVLSNRALLSVKVVPEFLGSNGRYAPPEDIVVYLADENGNISFDDDGQPRLAIDGVVSYSSSTQSYEIFLTDYINNLILDKVENNGIVLYPSFGTFLVNRAVLGGMKHPELAPKLEVFYINFPN